MANLPDALALLSGIQTATTSRSDAGVWENLGDGQVKAGQFGVAVASYKKSLDLDANQEETHKGLALAYFNLKDYVSSEIELTASISVYNAQYHGNVSTDLFHYRIKNINKVTKNTVSTTSN